MSDATSPAIAALTAAGVEFSVMPDAAAHAADEADGIRFFRADRAELPPVHMLIAPQREIDPPKVAEASHGTITDITELTQADLAAHVGRIRPDDEPVRTTVDDHLSRSVLTPRYLPSGVDGQSIVLPIKSLVTLWEAHTNYVSTPEILEVVAPHFVVTVDGVRSLDPTKAYFHVNLYELYFREVRQIMSIGSSDDYMKCFDEAVATAKRLLPKPPADELSKAHYAFLKER